MLENGAVKQRFMHANDGMGGVGKRWYVGLSADLVVFCGFFLLKHDSFY